MWRPLLALVALLAAAPAHAAAPRRHEASPVARAAHGPRPRHEALWVWDQGLSALDEHATTRLLDFAREHGVDTLYYESPDLLLHDPAALARFIDAAARQHVAVELLFGSTEWVLPDGQASAVSLVARAVRFAASVHGTPPVALHFDIEPHLLHGWRTTERADLIADYLELLRKLSAAARGMPIHVDIPFWYYRTPLPASVRGGERFLDQAVLGIVDGCTIMDYRNAAAGSNGLIADGSAVVSDADRAGKPLLIGVETNPVTPGYATFYARGKRAMGTEMSAVQHAFVKDPSFAGMAIEDYAGYGRLKP